MEPFKKVGRCFSFSYRKINLEIRKLGQCTRGSLVRRVGRPVSRSVGRSVNRSIGRSVGRSIGQSVDRSVGRSVCRSVGGRMRVGADILTFSHYSIDSIDNIIDASMPDKETNLEVVINNLASKRT